jgi:hypothetical protein
LITKFKLFERQLNNIILYHGSPYLFKEFKNRLTFFSETQKFAEDYANIKSMDYALDADEVIYKCKINGFIFDINNEEHYKKLEKLVPDEIEVYLSNFPISNKVDKETLLFALKGFYNIDPNEEILKGKVGDLITNPTYYNEKFLIVKKDDDYAYTINNNYLDEQLRSLSNFNFGTSKRRKYFDEYRNYIKSVIKSKTKEHISEESLNQVFYYKPYQKEYGITQDEIDKAKELYNIGKEKVIEDFTEEYSKKWNLKPEIEELEDTWRYYENRTIEDIIKKLNFEGYVAKEKNVNTYAIFNPKESVSIINYNYYGYDFKIFEDIKKFDIFNNKLYKHYNSISKFDRSDVYKWYKSDLPFDEILKRIDNDNKV